jgi:Flp pilus assembly protein protease CpaA
VKFVTSALLVYFGFIIAREDLKYFRIKNWNLIKFFLTLFISHFIQKNLLHQFFVGVLFLIIFLIVHIVGNILSSKGGIGFGDVKLITVVTFGYVNLSAESFKIYFFSLWWALLFQFTLYSLYKRNFLSHLAMAPSIFLAVGLYLCAPKGLHLPQ